jgi:hypothetical protein
MVVKDDEIIKEVHDNFKIIKRTARKSGIHAGISVPYVFEDVECYVLLKVKPVFNKSNKNSVILLPKKYLSQEIRLIIPKFTI